MVASLNPIQGSRGCLSAVKFLLPRTEKPSLNFRSSLTDYLRGAEVVAQRRFHITARPQSFEWKENGFKLHVPEGCLPAGTTDVTLDVGVSLSGQFESWDPTGRPLRRLEGIPREKLVCVQQQDVHVRISLLAEPTNLRVHLGKVDHSTGVTCSYPEQTC